MNRIDDKHIKYRTFKASDHVLLYNSQLRLFSGNLKSKWTGPYIVVKVSPSGAIRIGFDDEEFVVIEPRLKKYCLSVPVPAFWKPKKDILVSDPSKLRMRKVRIKL